jgi:hypothetical protein
MPTPELFFANCKNSARVKMASVLSFPLLRDIPGPKGLEMVAEKTSHNSV